MSRALAAVRFPDGSIKWTLYNGTCDLLIARLFDDIHTPWDAYYKRNGVDVDLWPDPEGEEYSVTIYSDYGSGWWWEGRAARNVVTHGTDPWDWPDNAKSPTFDRHNEKPDWFTEAYESARAVERATVTPDGGSIGPLSDR